MFGKILVMRCNGCNYNYEPFHDEDCEKEGCKGILIKKEATIKTIFKFQNGNVAITDENGQQIPHLQGALSGNDIEWNY